MVVTEADERLVKNSACEIWRVDDGVALRCGSTILVLDLVEFAAVTGACRRATARIYGKEKPVPVIRRGQGLKLIVDNARSDAEQT